MRRQSQSWLSFQSQDCHDLLTKFHTHSVGEDTRLQPLGLPEDAAIRTSLPRGWLSLGGIRHADGCQAVTSCPDYDAESNERRYRRYANWPGEAATTEARRGEGKEAYSRDERRRSSVMFLLRRLNMLPYPRWPSLRLWHVWGLNKTLGYAGPIQQGIRQKSSLS